MAEIVVQQKAQISDMPKRIGKFAKTAFLTPKYNARNSIFTLLLGFLVAVVLVFAVFQERGGSLIRDLFIGNFLDSNVAALWVDKVVALGLGGIAVGIGLKTGLLNIGVSGQMMGGAVVSLLILDQLQLLNIPARAVIACIFTVITSCAIAAFTGVLKAFCRVNEVVTSIMLNWVMVYVAIFLRDKTSVAISLGNTTGATGGPSPAAELGYSMHYAAVLDKTSANDYWILAGVGIIIFAIVAVAAYLLIYRSTLGFKMRATGSSPSASVYAGFRSKEIIVLSFVLSGAAAGLAGFVFYFLGNDAIDTPSFPANEGFQALSVALIANSNPIGIIFSAALFALLTGPIGGVVLGGLPADSILVFTATITYFVSLTNLFIIYHPIDRIMQWHKKRVNRKLNIAQAAASGGVS